VLDFEQWLSPLDGTNPSGVELRADERFPDLEGLMRPQVEVSFDARNNPAARTTVPVDWSEVLAKAEEIRASVRDLRLLVIVARALANTRGLAGLGDGLTLIARTLEMHWEAMHPALREGAAPREAALRRINTLLQLENPKDGLLGDLRTIVFLTPRGLGPITGRDLERGTLDARTVIAETADGLGAAEQARLAAEHEALVARVRTGCTAEADQRPEDYARLRETAQAAEVALAEVEQALNARLGNGHAVALPALSRFLSRLTATLDRAASGMPKPGQTAPAPGETAGPAPFQAAPEDAPLPAAQVGGFPAQLASRDEVVRCLDLIIAFYDRTEPSSPIPHLARRLRRMVPMDFLELMEDLAPSGLKEFRALAGVPDTKSKSAQKGDSG
jgi:type VI secretion system protein ImpA